MPDGDDRARALYHRHYSYRRRPEGQDPRLIVGPGEKLILVSPAGDALFAWRFERYRRDDQTGVNCAVFRNEGPERSSRLILAAEAFAAAKWPGERLFTFVRDDAVRSTNPGYCFQAAGWRKCGRTQLGLTILEKLPASASSASATLRDTGSPDL